MQMNGRGRDGALFKENANGRGDGARRAFCAAAAAAGTVLEFILDLPVYAVLAATAVLLLPAALVSRARRRRRALKIR